MRQEHLDQLYRAAVDCTGDRFIDNWEWKGRQHLDGKCGCTQPAQ